MAKLGAEITGLYARDLDRGRAAAADYGCPVYDSVDELLSKVEIADNCLPTFLHPATLKQATQAGRHIVCEKPWRFCRAKEKRSSAIVMRRRYASLSPWWCVSSRCTGLFGKRYARASWAK